MVLSDNPQLRHDPSRPVLQKRGRLSVPSLPVYVKYAAGDGITLCRPLFNRHQVPRDKCSVAVHPQNSKLQQERLDLRHAHIPRVSLVMEEDEPAHPAGVGLFGAAAVVAGADPGAELIEKFRGSFVSHNSLRPFVTH